MSRRQLWLHNALLRYGQFLVPAGQRIDWVRSWEAELWYGRSRGRHDYSIGIIRDALGLCGESWRQMLSGTAALCVGLLSLLVAFAAVPATLYASHTGGLLSFSMRMVPPFAVASGLTLLVSYASSFTPNAMAQSKSSRPRLRVWTLHVTKVVLLLLLAAFVSVDVCLPLEVTNCFAALPMELLFFVLGALLGLRWNLLDGQSRCRHCLRSLAPPQRVGRPSWNFLEYNGTELACLDGHGLLTVPEIETSWCRSSAWVGGRGCSVE